MREWNAPTLPAGWAISNQPPFVGRDSELQSVLAAFSDVVRGTVRGIFLEGAPGIGKTRLIAESSVRLRELGAAVFVGSCVAEYGAPLEPLGAPLAQLLDLTGPDAATDHSRRLIREALDPNPEAVHSAGLPTNGPGGDAASRLAAAIVQLLRDAAQVHPIVLVLDDLHWADRTMLRLLPRLIAGLAASRVLILAGSRNTAPDRSSLADDVLAELSRFECVRRIGLSPLTPDQVAEYVAARQPAATSGRSEIARRLSFLTGGNPFLLREAWRQVAGAGDSDAVVLPETVNDLFRTRLGSIRPDDRQILEAAAILGMDVVLDELVACTGQPASVIVGSLERASGAGLIEWVRGRGGSLRFTHAIARQALLDRIPASDLPVLHARAAESLDRLTPPPDRLVQRLAHHYTQAISLGYRQQAVEYTARAAELASSQRAYEDAARRYEDAADLSDTAERHAELIVSAARNWRLAAHFVQARELAREICESAVSARHRLRAAIEFEEASWRPGLPGVDAVRLLSAVLESASGRESDAERIVALAALARATSMAGRPDEAARIAATATAQAREQGDVELLLRVLRRAYVPSLRPGSLPRAYATAREFWQLGRQHAVLLGDDLHAGPHFCAAAAYVLGDRQVLDEADQALAAAAEQFGAFWQFWQECQSYIRHFIAGDLDRAKAASRRASAAEAEFRADAESNVPAQQLYMIKRERGDLGVARAVITGDESPHGFWAPGLLSLYTELRMVNPTRRLLSWLLEHDRPSAHESAEWPGSLALMTEAALLLDDKSALRRLRPWLAEYTGMNLTVGYFVTSFGAADRYLAQVDAALEIGDPGSLFGAALELEERFDAALYIAHTRAATVRWLRERDARSREASALAEQVRATATPQGWTRVLAVLDETTPGKGRSDGLTAREIEILRLLDEGLSNHGIATRLVISQHTAANHVRNILSKTGSRNRSQAVRYARDAGLLGTGE
ncbi:MAG: AAA family ATPase [Micropruina sp.]|uniref:helix-turn-helix transcriptional regulator n=1 Tax=Micropruina sp. TaxID=2737536 RepID=UPI0039E32BD3